MKYIVIIIQLILGLGTLWGIGLTESISGHFPPTWKIIALYTPIAIGLVASIMWFYSDYKGKNHSAWFWISCLSLLFVWVIGVLVNPS